MRPYFAFFRIRFIHSLQYRVAALAGLMTQFAWGFMLLLSYQAFHQAGPAGFPMTLPELSAYVWLQQAFLALYMTWFFESDIMESLRGGQIAYDLARPVDLYWRWFCRAAANRLAKAVLRSAPILVVALLLPEPLRLPLPPGPAELLLFLLSTLLGLGVVVACSMFVYISGFYTLSVMGIRILFMVVVDFLAGAILPLPFFPEGAQRVLQLLPFAAMQNLPLRLYSGNIAGAAAAQGIALQLFWLAALCWLGHRWMARSLDRVIVQGG